MARQLFSNNADSTLANAISNSATSITVQTGAGASFPVLANGDWCMLTLIKLVSNLPAREIIKVTARAGDVMTIVRAQEGTTAMTFSAGDTVRMTVTAGAMNEKAELTNPAFIGMTNTGTADMQGSTTKLAVKMVNAVEKVTRVASAATGTINLDLTTQAILHHTVAATANWTLNVRGNATNTLNSLMEIDDCVSVSMWAECGATAYRPTVFQVDGVAVTPRWLGGVAPTAGNASSKDMYTLSIVKTANAAFEVTASQGTAK